MENTSGRRLRIGRDGRFQVSTTLAVRMAAGDPL
jgi:hypothetical protein